MLNDSVYEIRINKIILQMQNVLTLILLQFQHKFESEQKNKNGYFD